MKFGPIVIGVDYPPDLLSRNTCLVCFVLKKKTNEVVATSIVERDSLHVWYDDKRSKFAPDDHLFILSTTSVVGVVVDMLEVEETPRRTLITPPTVN
jgi:hypothetical protein